MKLLKISLIILILTPALVLSEGEEKKDVNYTSQGMTAYSQGDYSNAIEFFKKALEQRPEYASLAYNIACCYALQDKKDSAYIWLEKTIELGTYKFADDQDFESLYDDQKFKDMVAIAEQKISLLQEKEWLPEIVLPAGDRPRNNYPVIIALHGFGGNPVNFSTTLGPAAQEIEWLLCCPYGPEIRGTTSFGWDKEEIAEQRILDAIVFLKNNYSIDTTRIVLLGYSQGGSRSVYTWFKNPHLFKGLITIAGYYDESLAKLYDPEKHINAGIYMIIGGEDRNLNNNEQAKKLFQNSGVPVDLVVYPDMGHAFPPDVKKVIAKAIDWIENCQIDKIEE
jgi:predicted esterase